MLNETLPLYNVPPACASANQIPGNGYEMNDISAHNMMWCHLCIVLDKTVIMRGLSNKASGSRPGRRSCQGRMLLISTRGAESIRQADGEGASHPPQDGRLQSLVAVEVSGCCYIA